jgi:hypothetical protein
VKCDDCGHDVATSKMPDDWAYDWWTHTLEGQDCPGSPPSANGRVVDRWYAEDKRARR